MMLRDRLAALDLGSLRSAGARIARFRPLLVWSGVLLAALMVLQPGAGSDPAGGIPTARAAGAETPPADGATSRADTGAGMDGAPAALPGALETDALGGSADIDLFGKGDEELQGTGRGMAGRMILGLLAVLAVIGMGTGLLKAYGKKTRRGPLSLVSRLTLARGAQAVIVRVRGRDLLLGVTPQSVSLIDQLGDAGDDAAEPAGSPFALALEAMGRRGGDA